MSATGWTVRILAGILVVPLLAGGGCVIWEKADEPNPQVRNDTDQPVWLGVEIGGGRLSDLGRVDPDSVSGVVEACNWPQVLVYSKRPENVASESSPVHAYDAEANPELCAEEHPEAVWVWDGRELVFTE